MMYCLEFTRESLKKWGGGGEGCILTQQAVVRARPLQSVGGERSSVHEVTKSYAILPCFRRFAALRGFLVVSILTPSLP